jgi:hypothetical protein
MTLHCFCIGEDSADAIKIRLTTFPSSVLGMMVGLFRQKLRLKRPRSRLSQGYVGGLAPCKNKLSGLAINRTHIPVKNIQAKRGYVFQAIRVNEDF